jgi:hypothetical protein
MKGAFLEREFSGFAALTGASPLAWKLSPDLAWRMNARQDHATLASTRHHPALTPRGTEDRRYQAE